MAEEEIKKEGIWQLTPRWLKIVLIVIIILILLAIGIKLYAVLRRPPNANYIEGGGSVPAGWIPDAVTDDLYMVIDGIFTLNSTKDAAFKEFNRLNDNQKIAVYNDWNKRYAAKTSFLLFPFGSLTQAVKDETGYTSIGETNQRDIMLENLKRLQLK